MNGMDQAIEYFTRDDCAGEFFTCRPYSATLSTTACAANWKRENSSKPEPWSARAKCRSCPIGAKHAGQPVVENSELFGSHICSRCNQPSSRLIYGQLCPSCVNRQYEFQRGYNAKGTRLVKLTRLDPAAARYRLFDGRVVSTHVPLAENALEPVIGVLRTAQGKVQFGWSAKPRKGWQQLSLFD